MSIGVFLVMVLVILVVIIRFIIAYLRFMTNRAVTQHFKAAEAISEGRVPEQWIQQINNQMNSKLVWWTFIGRKTSIEIALEKIDSLYRFFENSPFFRTSEARDILLIQIQQTRAKWQDMTWDELSVGNSVVIHSD